MAHCISRFFLIFAIAISQIVFAYAHAAMAMPAKPGQIVVICTPTGPQEIIWPMGHEHPPEEAHESFCPLCITGAALAAPEPSAKACAAEFHRITFTALVPALFRATDGSPYPARAPPV